MRRPGRVCVRLRSVPRFPIGVEEGTRTDGTVTLTSRSEVSGGGVSQEWSEFLGVSVRRGSSVVECAPLSGRLGACVSCRRVIVGLYSAVVNVCQCGCVVVCGRRKCVCGCGCEWS